MIQFIRLSALVSIVYITLVAVGKTSTPTVIGDLGDEVAVACTPSGSTPHLINAVRAVDYAEAVLIANGEIYYGQSSDQIRADIKALPAYDIDDGVSAEEVFALELLLEYGRQLAYAEATEYLEQEVNIEAPAGIEIASADGAIDASVLQALRGGC